jgi:putative ABC transport system permease protein
VKYLPLVWAALWRKPIEALLTWLAVTVAFALFGLMAGLSGTYRGLIEAARADQVVINARFNPQDGLPVALKDQLQRFDGVIAVSAANVMCGYHVIQSDTACVYFADADARRSMSDLPVTPAQWDALAQTRNGIVITRTSAQRWNLREGDDFPLTVRSDLRADGSTAWSQKVVAIVPDGGGLWGGHFVLGNLDYYDNALPPARRGRSTVYTAAIKDGSRASAIVRQIDLFFADSGTPTLSISARAAEEAMAHSNVDVASMTLVVAGAGLIMILFLVANGVARSVRERVPEFALLKTVGFSDAGVMALVFVEAAAPCILGAALGTTLAATLANWAVQLVPKNIVQVTQPNVSLNVLAIALVSGVLLALASSAAPIVRLGRLNVAAALANQAR